jgi:hypothetical protein
MGATPAVLPETIKHGSDGATPIIQESIEHGSAANYV